jgi:hypothetical protein
VMRDPEIRRRVEEIRSAVPKASLAISRNCGTKRR